MCYSRTMASAFLFPSSLQLEGTTQERGEITRREEEWVDAMRCDATSRKENGARRRITTYMGVRLPRISQQESKVI